MAGSSSLLQEGEGRSREMGSSNTALVADWRNRMTQVLWCHDGRLPVSHPKIKVCCCMQGDVVGLKARVGATLQQLDAARRLAAVSVAGLAEMDAVKQRMQAAASTLKVSQHRTLSLSHLVLLSTRGTGDAGLGGA